jgi:hypothetical protein
MSFHAQLALAVLASLSMAALSVYLLRGRKD